MTDDITCAVAVLGSGPAGCAAAAALANEEIDVCVIGPDTPWSATYGCWLDEVEAVSDWIVLRAEFAEVRVVGESSHQVPRRYGVLSNTAVRDTLLSGVAAIAARARRIEQHEGCMRVVLHDGRRVSARLVIDARGRSSGRVIQSAFGLVGRIQPASLTPGSCTLMDFSRATGGQPRFLYEMDLGGGNTLVEQTVLAAAPPVSLDVLESELRAHLRDDVEAPTGVLESERVWINMDPVVPLRTSGGVVPFGAAAGFVHPATGYSVATSFLRAEPLAASLAADLRRGVDASLAASNALEAVWPASLRRTRLLHRYGLGVLLSLDADGIRQFFDGFFELDPNDQAAYVSTETSPRVLAPVMTRMFRRASLGLKYRLVTAGWGRLTAT